MLKNSDLFAEGVFNDYMRKIDLFQVDDCIIIIINNAMRDIMINLVLERYGRFSADLIPWAERY
jgi:hypothetical protein